MSDPQPDLPIIALLGAPARCLLDEALAPWLARASAAGEVRRFSARAQERESLLAELRHELVATSLFGAERIFVVHDVKEAVSDDGIAGWMRRPSRNTRLWFAFVCAGRNALPEAPEDAAVSTVFVDAPRGPAELRRWIVTRAEGLGVQIEAGVADALIERTGAELDEIVAEMEKLALYCEDACIRVADVEVLTGHAAAQAFDEFWGHLKSGRTGPALELQARAATEGLRMFRGGSTYGESETASTLLILLTSRIRRVAAGGATDDKLREAACKALEISASYAHFLRQDHRDIGPARLERWVNAALAAEMRQRTTGGPPPELNLELLILDLAGERE